jgi:hypothetical protein
MIRIAQFKPFFRNFLLVFLLALTTNALNAQGFLAQKDLSQFKAEMLSEADITKIKERVQSQELTLDQLKAQATAKGMPIAEFEKLRSRLSSAANAATVIGNKMEAVENRQGNEKNNTSSIKEADASQSNLVFGAELFQNTGSLAANANIATPLNYEVGPNDVLKMVLYGIQEFSTELKVSYEGNVSIQNVGVVKVGGLTIEAATDKIRQQMARTAYPIFVLFMLP